MVTDFKIVNGLHVICSTTSLAECPTLSKNATSLLVSTTNRLCFGCFQEAQLTNRVY
jgi:hypothetical protein